MLVLDEFLLVSLFLFALYPLDLLQEVLGLYLSLALMHPIVLPSKLHEVLHLVVGLFVDGRNAHDALLHVQDLAFYLSFQRIYLRTGVQLCLTAPNGVGCQPVFDIDEFSDGLLGFWLSFAREVLQVVVGSVGVLQVYLFLAEFHAVADVLTIGIGTPAPF